MRRCGALLAGMLMVVMGCEANTAVSASAGPITLTVPSNGPPRLAIGPKVAVGFVTLGVNVGVSERRAGHDDIWVLAVRHTENGQRLDTEYEIPSKSTPHAGISGGSLTRVDIYLDPDRQRITIDVPSSQETVTVHINDEKLPPLPAKPSSEAGPHPHRLDVPDGGGWAQVDAARRHLTVCDTEANDRGIGVDYTVDDEFGVNYHRGDANGSEPPCGQQCLKGGLHFHSFRVCETDSPAGTNAECSDWEVVAAS